MADYTAKWRIQGENGMQATFRSILGDAKATADKMSAHFRTVGAVFRGGAIAGALIAFERLAENAEKSAEAIGDKGTAQALRQLNAEIDTLKSKGTNLIGKVFGEAYINFRGTELQKAEQDIKAIRAEIDRLLQSSGGRRDIPGIVERERQLAELEARANDLAPAGPSAALGSFRRTRAVSRGGGSDQLVETIDPKAEAAAAKAAEEAARAAAEMLKLQADAYADVYKSGLTAMQALETPHEAILRNFEDQKFALEQLAETYPAFADAADEAMARLVVTTDDQLEALKRIPVVAEESNSQMSVFAEQAARNMQSHFAEFFYSFDGGLKGMAAGFVDTLRRMAAELAAQQLLMSFFSWGASTFGGGVGSFFSSLSKGMRATGGDVKGGSPYWVGERGPELFVPGASGAIVPNHAMGGAGNVVVNVHNNIDARGATTDLVKVLPNILERQKRETVALAVAAVRDNVRRRGHV